MNYMIGYQLQESGALLREIEQHRNQVHEVYFSWGTMPSGRGRTVAHSQLLPHEAQARQLNDLEHLASLGIATNLLLNANCYGADSLSRRFLMETGDLVDYLAGQVNTRSVTTTSPVLAHFLKENFPELEIRASVNMEVGTIPAMEYLADDFDSFYYKRELNRDLPQLQILKTWCDDHGKKLYMLANSGCLNFCSARQFHDNLVAHEQEIARMDNGTEFKSACSRFVSKAENRLNLLSHMNCVRPEDMGMYEPYVVAAKLATRVSPRPEAIVRAYMAGAFRGNFLDLTEPSHTGAFYPTILDNTKFPADYQARVSACDKQCDRCGYCRQVLEQISVTLSNDGIMDLNECHN